MEYEMRRCVKCAGWEKKMPMGTHTQTFNGVTHTHPICAQQSLTGDSAPSSQQDSAVDKAWDAWDDKWNAGWDKWDTDWAKQW